MPADLDELREQKKALLLESDINRQIMALEVGQIRLKAVEWRRSLTKVGAVYKFVAPLAGIGFGFLAARKQVHKAQQRARHNANGHHRKPNVLGVIAPFAAPVLRQAFTYLRNRRQAHAGGAG